VVGAHEARADHADPQGHTAFHRTSLVWLVVGPVRVGPVRFGPVRVWAVIRITSLSALKGNGDALERRRQKGFIDPPSLRKSLAATEAVVCPVLTIDG
jgi:hypothetical protein